MSLTVAVPEATIYDLVEYWSCCDCGCALSTPSGGERTAVVHRSNHRTLEQVQKYTYSRSSTSQRIFTPYLSNVTLVRSARPAAQAERSSPLMRLRHDRVNHTWMGMQYARSRDKIESSSLHRRPRCCLVFVLLVFILRPHHHHHHHPRRRRPRRTRHSSIATLTSAPQP